MRVVFKFVASGRVIPVRVCVCACVRVYVRACVSTYRLYAYAWVVPAAVGNLISLG